MLADYTELRGLRASLRQVLDAQSLTPGEELDDVAERMTIIATELATNALVHAQSPAAVRLGRGRSAFVLDVADDRPSSAPRIAEQRPAGAGGHGLAISQELSLDMGWYITGATKHVWAQIGIPRRAPRISVFGLDAVVRCLRKIGGQSHY